MSLSAVYGVVQTAITSAINSAGITNSGQVIIGWPLSTELIEILGQTNEEYQVSIYMTKSSKATRYIEPPLPLVAPIQGLTAVVTPTTITFSGSVLTTTNIHTFLYGISADAYVQVAPGTSLSVVAAQVAAAITTGPFPVDATSSGPVVLMNSGATLIYCNIGASTNLLQEVARLDATLQVTIWTTGDPITVPIGDAIADAIKQTVGTVNNHRYVLPDGSSLYLAFRDDEINDLSQSSYSLYQYRLIYDAEYGTIATTPSTQVGGVISMETTDAYTPITAIFGGPL
jgi:hypothetical protein